MALKSYATLPPGWVDETDPNPGGVQAYYRNPTRCGPLQISWLERTRVGQPRRTAFLIRQSDLKSTYSDVVRDRKGKRPMRTRFYGTAKCRIHPCCATVTSANSEKLHLT